MVEYLKKQVKRKGYPMLKNTPYCKMHLEDNQGKCEGCEGEEGCLLYNEYTNFVIRLIAALGDV